MRHIPITARSALPVALPASFDGAHLSGLLWQQKVVKNARIMLADLPDAEFKQVVTDELNRRALDVAQDVVRGVCK